MTTILAKVLLEAVEKSKIPAYKRKASAKDDSWKVTLRDIEDEEARDIVAREQLRAERKARGEEVAEDATRFAGTDKLVADIARIIPRLIDSCKNDEVLLNSVAIKMGRDPEDALFRAAFFSALADCGGISPDEEESDFMKYAVSRGEKGNPYYTEGVGAKPEHERLVDQICRAILSLYDEKYITRDTIGNVKPLVAKKVGKKPTDKDFVSAWVDALDPWDLDPSKPKRPRKVVFTVHYNVCGVEDDIGDVLSDRITDKTAVLYNDDGAFVGDEQELADIIRKVVGDCEIEFDWSES